jgi:hypothetical protein
MSFSSGDKVICIDNFIKEEARLEVVQDFDHWVEKDKHYIIRDVFYNDGIATGVTLEGVVNRVLFMKLIGRNQEASYGEFRFRKLKDNEVIVTEEVEEVALF